MSTITLSVTAADILHGEQSDCYTCPIARALTRRFPGKRVEVYSFGAFLYNEDSTVYKTFGLDDRTKEFICDFDQDGSGAVKPSRFNLTEGLSV